MSKPLAFNYTDQTVDLLMAQAEIVQLKAENIKLRELLTLAAEDITEIINDGVSNQCDYCKSFKSCVRCAECVHCAGGGDKKNFKWRGAERSK